MHYQDVTVTSIQQSHDYKMTVLTSTSEDAKCIIWVTVMSLLSLRELVRRFTGGVDKSLSLFMPCGPAEMAAARTFWGSTAANLWLYKQTRNPSLSQALPQGLHCCSWLIKLPNSAGLAVGSLFARISTAEIAAIAYMAAIARWIFLQLTLLRKCVFVDSRDPWFDFLIYLNISALHDC